MDNTRIETQPTVTGRVETPAISSEIATEIGAVENSSAPVVEISPNVETTPELTETPVGVEVSTETPKPSAGYQIQPGSTGTSRIILEKMINKITNL